MFRLSGYFESPDKKATEKSDKKPTRTMIQTSDKVSISSDSMYRQSTSPVQSIKDVTGIQFILSLKSNSESYNHQ